MTIRLASCKDIEAMHRVRLAVRENVLTSAALVTPRHYRDMLERDGRGWVFETDAGIVGFAVADHVRRNVWALFVHPAHEHRGIGRALHDTMMTWLFEVGHASVWLATTPGTRAERFYRAAGWLPAGTHDNDEVRFEMTYERHIAVHEQVVTHAKSSWRLID